MRDKTTGVEQNRSQKKSSPTTLATTGFWVRFALTTGAEVGLVVTFIYMAALLHFGVKVGWILAFCALAAILTVVTEFAVTGQLSRETNMDTFIIEGRSIFQFLKLCGTMFLVTLVFTLALPFCFLFGVARELLKALLIGVKPGSSGFIREVPREIEQRHKNALGGDLNRFCRL